MKHLAIALATVLATIAVAFSAAPADARCAGARPFFSPSRGTLHKRSRVFLFVPRAGKISEFRVIGSRGIKVTTRRLPSSSPSMFVVQVDIDARAARRITLRAETWAHGYKKWARKTWAKLSVGSKRAAALGATVWGPRKKSVFSWTCSHQRGFELRVQPMAPAYRVVWAASRAALDDTSKQATKRKTTVLPPSMVRFFDYGKPTVVKRPSLFLGFRSCFGRTIAWGKGPIYVRVQPLFSNNQEGAPSLAQRLVLR